MGLLCFAYIRLHDRLFTLPNSKAMHTKKKVYFNYVSAIPFIHLTLPPLPITKNWALDGREEEKLRALDWADLGNCIRI